MRAGPVRYSTIDALLAGVYKGEQAIARLGAKGHMAFASAGATPAADVLALYRNIGGMAYMDDEYWRLWSLDEIIEENVKRSNVGVQFSDYMMSCWHFTVKAVDATRSEVWIDNLDGNGPLLVASSLGEFFDIYVSAYPTRVLDPGHFKLKKAC